MPPKKNVLGKRAKGTQGVRATSVPTGSDAASSAVPSKKRAPSRGHSSKRVPTVAISLDEALEASKRKEAAAKAAKAAARAARSQRRTQPEREPRESTPDPASGDGSMEVSPEGPASGSSGNAGESPSAKRRASAHRHKSATSAFDLDETESPAKSLDAAMGEVKNELPYDSSDEEGAHKPRDCSAMLGTLTTDSHAVGGECCIASPRLADLRV